MDLGKWLRDRKKDVEKRWQNSVVLDAVSANTEADKARRAQQVAQGNPLSVNQQASQTYGSGLSAPVNRVKDLFSANTQADAMKRLSQTGLSETYDQQQKRLTDQAVNTQSNRNGLNQFARSGLSNIANRVMKVPSDAGNIIGAASKTGILRNVPIIGNVSSLDRATGSKGADILQSQAKRADTFTTNKLQQSQLGARKGENKYINSTGQLATDLPLQAATGGAGLAALAANTASSEYNKARDAGKSNNYALGVGAAQAGASALSEKIGMDKFLPGNGVTGNIATKAAKRFITEGAQEAQQQFTQNLITNKAYDPNQSLKEGVAQSAVMGGLAGAGMSPVLDLAAGVSTGAKPSQPQAPPVVKQQVAQAKPVLQQTGIPAQPGSLRERIQVAKDNVTNTIASSITPMDQNGFVTVGRTPKNIHPDDQAVMDAYIAHTRGYGAKLSEAQATDLELTAMHIADRYGMGDVNTLPKQLAGIFDKRLIQDNYVGPNGEPTAKTYGYTKPTKSSFFRPMGEVGGAQMGDIPGLNKLASISKRIKNSNLVKNEGGYAKNPFYDKKNDVAQDLTPEQSDFINEYANMLKNMGQDNGVDINPMTGAKISNNVRTADTAGKAMTEADWFNEARKQIESSKGAFGASEEYKALAKQAVKTTNRYGLTKEQVAQTQRASAERAEAQVNQKSDSRAKLPKPPVENLPSISDRIAESKLKLAQSQDQSVRPSIPTTDTSASRLSNMAQDTPIEGNSTTKQGNKQDSRSPIKQASDEIRAKNGGGLVANQKEILKRTQQIVDERNVSNKGDALSPENYAKTFGTSKEQANKDLNPDGTPRFNAATRSDKGKDADKLFTAMKTDAKISKATADAQASGKELNFYAKKDANDRSVGIEQFNPDQHSIEAGFVVDKKGNVLGNHIKVDENGIQVNVGGKVVNMDSVIGNPLDWGSAGKIDKSFKGRYKLSETMNRNIDNNAPSAEIANQTKHFLWNNKVKAEANMRQELDAEYKALGARIKNTNKARPSGVSKEQWKDDIFSVLNGDKTDTQIQETYGKKAQAILDYKKETRTLYDSLLKRVNTERVKFGQSEITPRKDYITHLQELNGSKSFVADVYGAMKNSFADEGMGKTRNGVPGEIAGRTEGFKPISKYNPFLQRRTGTKSLRDPYQAVQEYLQPALYNIHMTESGARARAVESAFRTAEAIKNTDAPKLLKEADGIFKKYNKSSDNSKLITGFQEYANAIAGKTQRFDRQLIDSSDTAAKGVKAWQGLQRIGGRATILGNVSSTLAQPLNQVVGLADAGPVNYMKGIAAAVSQDPAIDKSDFIRARETEATKPLRTKGEKVLDAGGIPLQAAELASVKLMWHTQHQKALSQGMTGKSAIQEADLNTERLVAGRGIADKPEVYRSTVASGLLQYTLEVNAQNKTFWQDLSPKQKATFLVASTATNTLMGAVTGFEPLPDFLKAMFETGKDFLDPDNEDNPLKKTVKGAQRMLGEYSSMNPLISGPANALLPDSVRKTVFGAESDLGRYPGGTAPVSVIKNAVDAGTSLSKGEFRNARDSTLKVVPFGNQIRKTTQGVEALNRGYAVDKKGEKTFDAPTSPVQQARTAVFGPSASKQATDFYNKKDSSSSRSSKAFTSSDSNRGNFSEIAKNAFNSKEGKAFMALKDDTARKDFARQNPDNRAIYDNYQAMKKAYSGGDDLLAPGLDETSTKVLDKYDRMTTKAKEKNLNKNSGAEYEYELANFNNKKANGEINLIDEINSQQKLGKLKATKGFEKGYRDIYSGLSKAEVYNLITTNPDGKKIADQLLGIDDALVALGNKSKFRDKYGNIDFNPEKAGGKAKSTGVSEANNLRIDTLSKLNSLLSGTQKPVTGYKKVSNGKVALKKYKVKK